LFSNTYKSLFPQPQCFHIHTKPRGCTACLVPRDRPSLPHSLPATHQPLQWQSLCFHILTNCLSRKPFILITIRIAGELGSDGSAWTRTQRRARRESARAHAEARAEGRRNIAQEIAAAGAAAFYAERSGSVGAQPLASRFALRVYALHRETGQILHIVSPSAAASPSRRRPVARPEFPVTDGCWRGFWRRPLLLSSGKTTIYWGAVAKGSWHIRCRWPGE
jgi:hypothetical protein